MPKIRYLAHCPVVIPQYAELIARDPVMELFLRSWVEKSYVPAAYQRQQEKVTDLMHVLPIIRSDEYEIIPEG